MGHSTRGAVGAACAALVGAIVLGAGLWSAAHAEGGIRMKPVDHAATLKECGACHMAFPPQFLPQRSWQELLAHLDNHFGDNATLDPAVQADILAYLTDNAADAPATKNGKRFLRGIKPDATPLRITQLAWWRGAHEEVDVSNLKATKVKTAANCVGCHKTATKGYFGEGG